MTAQRAVQVRPGHARASRRMRTSAAGLRLIWLHAASRRAPAALAALFGLLVVVPIVFIEIPGKITKNLGEYMPEAGEQAYQLLHSGAYTLGPWQGTGVLAAYVVVAAVAAFALIVRRDA